MLATMIERVDAPALNGIEVVVSELPTGTVTLLLADVEGSTRLWESQPEEMTAALARLNRTVSKALAAHDGVRPVEQGEGDSFVAAFARASDAVACALELQRAPLAPIRIRIGIHTGEVQLRSGSGGEGNYAGPTINRTARIRDLGHGGQTVLSGATEAMVIDRLPADTWLTELGSYPLRGVPRPERVLQLCHPDLRNEFPALRTSEATASHNLPVQLTSFVGRQTGLDEVCRLVAANPLVTLTGAGGAGKTRLAIEVAAGLAADFCDGVWFVELAPITNPVLAPIAVARTLGLPDQPGLSTMDTVLRLIKERKILLLLDNCEHLLDACGTMAAELLQACPHLTILATSREPLGVPGELSWLVPSLALSGEAIELFTDRARRVRPDFVVGEDNAALVTEICKRLDGMPLAIELAAARIRALSLRQILDSLHDRFRLLTGGARTAVRRQQTLRASVDWSHALLTEPEQMLFRRLAVFAGGFDLEAAQAVGADSEVQRYQLLDQLSLLVDKSLVVASETGTDTGAGMRYRLMETVRQYAQEKLGESGESGEVRTRHRDYYAATAATRESRGHSGDEELVAWAQTEIDNLRAAFAWSRENGELETALQLVLSLRPLWLLGGRGVEALTGLAAILADDDHSRIAPAVRVGAVAQQGTLSAFLAMPMELSQAQEALAVARELDDPALLTHALIACGMVGIYNPDAAQRHFAEAIDLARAADDQWSLCEIFSYQATASFMAGEPVAARTAAEAGRDLADALGDHFFSRNNRVWGAVALMWQGDLSQATRVARGVADEAEAAADLTTALFAHSVHSMTLVFQGQATAGRAATQSALATADAIGGVSLDTVHGGFAYAALAAGDAAAARQEAEEAMRHTVPVREVFTRSSVPIAEAVLACGELAAARRWADETVAMVPGYWQMNALIVRAFVAMAQGEPDQAERDAHDALAIAARTQGYLRVADTLECLARLSANAGNHQYAARLLGGADTMRQRMGHPRFPMYQAGYDATVAVKWEALGQNIFDAAWANGAALSTEEAIGYAQRGRGERKRPTSGWASLTPTELDVVRLVGEGLPNKDIGTRLFISPRTVQTHLTHVYTKLGVSSRVQLAQQAARRN